MSKKLKHYTNADEIFMLDEIAKYKVRKEGFAAVAKALNRNEGAIQTKFCSLKKVYPKHPVFNMQLGNSPKTMTFFMRVKKAWNILLNK